MHAGRLDDLEVIAHQRASGRHIGVDERLQALTLDLAEILGLRRLAGRDCARL